MAACQKLQGLRVFFLNLASIKEHPENQHDNYVTTVIGLLEAQLDIVGIAVEQKNNLPPGRNVFVTERGNIFQEHNMIST